MRRVVLLLSVALLLVTTTVRAQVQPPPLGDSSPVINTAPGTAPATPPAPEAPPAPPATGTLAPASPPPPPAAPTLAPMPAQGPPLALEAPMTTARPVPFYKKVWFWGAVGVVVLSAVLITVASTGSSGPETPDTILGDMHAF